MEALLNNAVKKPDHPRRMRPAPGSVYKKLTLQAYNEAGWSDDVMSLYYWRQTIRHAVYKTMC
jgi:hypothetical protein